MTVFISDENKRNFWTYFNVADELYGGLDLDEIVLVAVVQEQDESRPHD